jgi:hypothetical protein
MSNPDFGKFAGPKSREQTAHLRKTQAAHCLLILERVKPRRSSARVPSRPPRLFPSPLAGEGPGVRGIVPRVPSRVPLDWSVPSRHGRGWVNDFGGSANLLNQSVPTHRPFCDRSPVQSQRVQSHPSLSRPLRMGPGQTPSSWGDRHFLRAFLGETTCPVPVSRSRRRPDACRSVRRLWTLDFGPWTSSCPVP